MDTLIQDHELSHKIEEIFDSNHSLCRSDLIWILNCIKKRVAEEDPTLLNLSQPRLLKNFHYFAEIAMLLIHQRSFFDLEVDRLKQWAYEASFGLDCYQKPSEP